MDNSAQMQQFMQLAQNPQMLQRLQDPAIRGQLAQQLAGQFAAPPPEAMQAVGSGTGWNVNPQLAAGLADPRQRVQAGAGTPAPQPPAPGGAQGGPPPMTTPFLQGLTQPVGSRVPVQFDQNGVPQTPFLPMPQPNQAPFVAGQTGGMSPAQGQADSANQLARGLIPGGVPQGQGVSAPQNPYMAGLLRQYGPSVNPNVFNSPFA